MNKIKVLKFFRIFILYTVLVTTFYIVNQYNEINNFYIQKKENYTNLKKLNNEILDTYEIDLKANEELYELSRQVNYDEHMISGLEPNSEAAKNYWWILISVFGLVLLIKWIDYIIEPSENKVTSE